jgi:hypothetical protein
LDFAVDYCKNGRENVPASKDLDLLNALVEMEGRLRGDMRGDMQCLRSDMQSLRGDMQSDMQSLKRDMQSLKRDMENSMESLRSDLENLTARVEDKETRARTASRIAAVRTVPLAPYQQELLAATGSAFMQKRSSFRVPSPVAQ